MFFLPTLGPDMLMECGPNVHVFVFSMFRMRRETGKSSPSIDNNEGFFGVMDVGVYVNGVVVVGVVIVFLGFSGGDARLLNTAFAFYVSL